MVFFGHENRFYGSPGINTNILHLLPPGLATGNDSNTPATYSADL
jgi:hypothetical protein